MFIFILLFDFYLKNMVFIFVGVLFLFFIFWFNKEFWQSKKVLLIFLTFFVLLIISLFVFFNEIDPIEIAFKRLIYVFSLFFISYYGFIVGINLSIHNSQKDNFFMFLLYVFLFNAIVTIMAWFITTGGIMARYNFISPINQATSGNIHLTTIGMLILFENFNYKKLSSYLIFFIFLFNYFIAIVRAEQVILIFSLFLYFLLRTKNKLHIRVFIFAIILFITTIVLTLTNLFSYFISVFNDNSAIVRSAAIRDAIRLFKRYPITGIGYGMYPFFKDSSILIESVHNGIFGIMAETGIVGIVIFIIFMALIIATIYFLYNKSIIKNKYNTLISVFLMGNILRSFFQNSFIFPPPQMSYYLCVMLVWIFVGIILKQKNFYKKHIPLKTTGYL